MEAEDRGREPARWCMHWSEVSVFDDNAAAFGIDISNLMEAAGQGLAAQAIRMLEESGKRRGPVWILCGPGNNGGDGFVIARHLINRGYNIQVYTLTDTNNYKGDALRALQDFKGTTKKIRFFY